ncbi:MAG: YhgE/Pip domain-containing protein [Arcanobacterium sp.]|nr:YhgE/Pip domain-containing protein [Arcanobacterium sp.]
MRGVFRVFLNDLRAAWRSVMAMVVLCGLVLIPLLFTWFNVLASWDPLGSTGRIKVAVASVDQGFDSEFLPMPINIGEEVLSQLRANDQLDWIITNEDGAIDGTKSGEYYAAIVIPEDFSREIMTFYSDGSEPTNISVYTNEKKNALAPKITDQGANGVSAQISQTFAQTLSDVCLRVISSLNEYMNRDETQKNFDRIAWRAERVSSQLKSGAQTARAFSGLLSSSVALVESAERIMNAPSLDISRVDLPLSASDASLSSAVTATMNSYDVLRQRVDKLYSSAAVTDKDRRAVLKELAEGVQHTIDHYQKFRSYVDDHVTPVLPEAGAALTDGLDRAIAEQVAVHSSLVEAEKIPAPQEPDFSSIDRAKKALADVRSADLPNALSQLRASFEDMEKDLDFSRVSIDLDTAGLENSGESIAALAVTLDTYAQEFSALATALSNAGDSGDFSQLKALVGADPDVLAAMIAAPVALERESVFSVASFGAGMAPLYTTLALWMGSLLTAVTLRTDVASERRSGREGLHEYFGRFGIFALIGLCQSTLVGLGLIYFIQLQPVHPFLLMTALWLSSLVFMFVVYTLVAMFSNVGKALGVLLMVFQISAAGGSYPLQLLPQWFQNIGPWLPGTYAISAFRAAMAGEYDGDYWKALLGLCAFLIPAVLIMTVLRKPLTAYNEKFTRALEATKLM